MGFHCCKKHTKTKMKREEPLASGGSGGRNEKEDEERHTDMDFFEPLFCERVEDLARILALELGPDTRKEMLEPFVQMAFDSAKLAFERKKKEVLDKYYVEGRSVGEKKQEELEWSEYQDMMNPERQTYKILYENYPYLMRTCFGLLDERHRAVSFEQCSNSLVEILLSLQQPKKPKKKKENNGKRKKSVLPWEALLPPPKDRSFYPDDLMSAILSLGDCVQNALDEQKLEDPDYEKHNFRTTAYETCLTGGGGGGSDDDDSPTSASHRERILASMKMLFHLYCLYEFFTHEISDVCKEGLSEKEIAEVPTALDFIERLADRILVKVQTGASSSFSSSAAAAPAPEAPAAASSPSSSH